MQSIRLSLLALVFGLSACSFSFASGPNPHSTDPGSLSMMHGRGKPARRRARDAVPAVAKADRSAKPAKAGPGPEPPAKAQMVLPARVVEPQPRLVLHASPVDAQPRLVLHASPVDAQPKLVLHASPVDAQPKLVLHASPVDAQPKLLLPARVVDSKPRKTVTRR